MFTKKVTYTDFDGNERTDTLYFNLSKTEMTKMQLEVEGGLIAKLNKMVESKDIPAMVSFFDDLIVRAYGEKSDDGRRLIKNRNGHSLGEEFKESIAYDVLFSELVSDETSMKAFVTGVVPSEVRTQALAPVNG